MLLVAKVTDFTDKLDRLELALNNQYGTPSVYKQARAAVVSLFDAERARAEAAERERDEAKLDGWQKVAQRMQQEYDQQRGNAIKLQQERDAALKELARVREALLRHGMHDAECETNDYRLNKQRCTCGLEAALKGDV